MVFSKFYFKFDNVPELKKDEKVFAFQSLKRRNRQSGGNIFFTNIFVVGTIEDYFLYLKNYKNITRFHFENKDLIQHDSEYFPHFLETLESESPLKFHLDLDYVYKENDDLNFENLMDLLERIIIPLVKEVFNQLTFGKYITKSWDFYSSSTEKKFSIHVIFHDIVFKTRHLLSYFFNIFGSKLVEKNVGLNIIDSTIYQTGKRFFRLVGSNKYGNEEQRIKRVLKNRVLQDMNSLSFDDLKKSFLTCVDESYVLNNLLDYDSKKHYKTKFSHLGHDQQNGARVYKRRKLNPKRQKELESQLQNENLLIQTASEYLEKYYLETFAGLILSGVSISNYNGFIEVRFKPKSDGFKCPFGHLHTSNSFLVLMDRNGQVDHLFCYGSHDNGKNRIEKFCDKCNSEHFGKKCTIEARRDLSDNFYREFLKKIPKSGTKKFGGEDGTKKYHSKNLTSDVCKKSSACIAKKIQYVYINTSDMGCGKTTQIAFLVRFWRQKLGSKCKMLVLTSRCALAAQLAEDLNRDNLMPLQVCDGPQETTKLKGPDIDFPHEVIDFENLYTKAFPATLYSDFPKDCDLFEEKLVICQAESVHRLRSISYKPDIVIIDEATSHLKQLRSDKTFKSEAERLAIRDEHIAFCKNSKVLVLACADMTENIRDHFLKYYVSSNALVDCVNIESCGRNFHVFNIAKVKQMILDCVIEKRNVWISCTTLRDAKDIKNRIEKIADENGDMQLKNGILILSGDKSVLLETKNDILKRKKLKEHTLGEYWSGPTTKEIQKKTFPVKVFIHTPSITHGFSYESEHFQDFFCLINASVDVASREAIQMCGRVRNNANWIIGKLDTRERFDNLNPTEIAKSKLLKQTTNANDITSYGEYYGNDKEDLEAKILFLSELEGKSYNASFIKNATNHPQNTVFLNSNLNAVGDTSEKIQSDISFMQQIKDQMYLYATNGKMELVKSLFDLDSKNRPKLISYCLIVEINMSRFIDKYEIETNYTERDRLFKCFGFSHFDLTMLVDYELIKSLSPNGSLHDYKCIAINLVYRDKVKAKNKTKEKTSIEIVDWVDLMNDWILSELSLFANARGKHFTIENGQIECNEKLDPKMVRLANHYLNGTKASSTLYIESVLENFVEIRIEKLRKSLYKLEEKLNEENQKYIEKEENGIPAATLLTKEQYKVFCQETNIKN